MVCAIGGLPKCAKFGCSGHTFWGCWLLLILMVFHYKSMVSSSYNNYCYVHQWVCYKGVKFEIKFEKKMGFNET